MTDYVIMPKADYQGACDAIRAKTGKTDLIKSGDMATEIEEMQTGGGDEVKYLEAHYADVVMPTATKIKKYAFYSDTTIKTVTLPNVTSVGTYAFYKDSVMTSIDVPKLQSVGTYAFNGCTKMNFVTPPEVSTSIGSYAFQGCSNLQNMSLGEGITTIPSYAFGECRKLKMTPSALPKSVTTIGDGAFAYNELLELSQLHDSITSIGKEAFCYCSKLTWTSLPKSLTSLGTYAFRGCSNLALTSLPEGLTSIGMQAFEDCTNLALTSIHANIKTINANAFARCKNMTNITFEGSTNLGNYAFTGCTGLKLVKFKGTPSSLSASAFYNLTNIGIIKVPWAEGAVANAPWGASKATIVYDYDPVAEENAKEITFTVGANGINDTTYTAKEGMTWLEFICSDYNTSDDFSIATDGAVWRGGLRVSRETESNYETKLDVIEEGYTYWNGNA